MKRKLGLLLVLLCSAPLWAATWYATSSSVNINAASLWVPTSTGSCTGSGTPLTFGSQANGDVFDANGCTSLAVNVDPGVGSASACTNTVTVTLQSNATNGGGFTYATATNIFMHANVTATKTTALTITGNTGGGTLCGNVMGGSTASINGVSDSHSSVTTNYVGSFTGGSSTNDNAVSSSGPATLTGNATPGSGAGAAGINTASATLTLNGNCNGSDALGVPGCNISGTGTLTVNGNIVNGKKSGGAVGPILFGAAATNYIVYPANNSYNIANCTSGIGSCTNGIILPVNPGAANVKNGLAYGPYTGTYLGVTALGEN